MSKFIGVPLPTEEGLWWWVAEDEGPPIPIVVEVLIPPNETRLCAGMGQHGWNWDQPVEDMGGLWMKVEIPEIEDKQ